LSSCQCRHEIDGNCCNILLRAMSWHTESAFHDFPSIPAWCSCSIILSRSHGFAMSTFKSCLRSPNKFYNSDQQDQLLSLHSNWCNMFSERLGWNIWINCQEWFIAMKVRTYFRTYFTCLPARKIWRCWIFD